MKKTIYHNSAGGLLAISVVLSACSNTSSFQVIESSPKNIEQVDIEAETSPEIVNKPQNIGNITVADAAKVSDAELEEAVTVSVVQSEQNLGKTIASLGLIDEAGFWLRTPLVLKQTEGRVVNITSGKSINLLLIPNERPTGSGSQISIAAMQALGIPIVELAELNVYSQ